ncbi:5-hydroxyisourate hydrolase [Nocardioides sp. YR527]|uniref:hydroxyisourate hydrolase n=1 Tax=Nocardioides sp. YR527 TaxID=1881028 RepID=UPI000881D59B|nr:hydroxyisourate hydrolase [Nocardioides sp. YR527]SDK78233.1 5-hydroxyisourate hydrolase [Nocardioides sp. YR527]
MTQPHPTTVSTHVLDAALGRPAAGLDLILVLPDDSARTATTDADGRVRFEGEVLPGPHILTFATGPWFAEQDRETFFPEVSVGFTVTAGEHHHVALLLSPFSYTTYRGS